MKIPLGVILIFQLYPLLLLPLQTLSLQKIPRLSRHDRELTRTWRHHDDVGNTSSRRFYYYNQTLDHFNYAPGSYATFQQRYVVVSEHWGGASSDSPIFAYLGAEGSIDYDVDVEDGIGFLNENAPRFNALSVYIEHRFYGKSIPFGTTIEEALKNESTRGYFNSAQAIADYAKILLHIRHQFSAYYSPIIVIGASYGGMLASWFRLKYPHIALGALASSSPILYFDNITPPDEGYYSIVTKDFKEVSQNCFDTIRKSWDEIDKIASQPGGLSILTQRFKLCSQLNNTEELKEYLELVYAAVAQHNRPPNYPLQALCRGIDGAPTWSDLIGRIIAGVATYQGNSSCCQLKESQISQTELGWEWQTCSEMVMPMGKEENDILFPPSPFDLHQFTQDCTHLYGVQPRPHWITTYYGGHDIKMTLKRFGSNIIFSNGLKDPYSGGGVLEDLSESIIAVTTANGSHCLDMLMAKETDPEWLIMQRKEEVSIIEGWLSKYYAELHAAE